MLRDESIQEISDGRKYSAGDMVRADSHGCRNCHICCTGMGDSVILDPMDIMRISEGLNVAPSELIGNGVELGMYDGNILPHLSMQGEEEACYYLNKEGRCSIHTFRPGFCRMFPLGRLYENRSFSYILQVHECPVPGKSKVRVSKWLDTPNLKQYEQYVLDWHNFLEDVRGVLPKLQDETIAKNLNLYLLREFYLTPYNNQESFYEEYRRRREKAEALLSLAEE